MVARSGADSEKSKKFNFNIDMNLKGRLTASEKVLIRIAVMIFVVILAYSGISIFLNNSMKNKSNEIAQATQDVNNQIALISNDTTRVKTNTSKYVSMTERLNDLNAKAEEKSKRKNAIPALLNRIMYIIPKGVQITSIENTTGNKIVINAQASSYEQLGYFKVSIRKDEVLKDVVSDNGQKQTQDGVVKTTIEGNLPID